MGWVIVFSGVSIGVYEVYEFCDGGDCYMGKGVGQVVNYIEEWIVLVFCGFFVLDQVVVDVVMLELDGSDNKFNLGVNVILVVSMVIVCVVVNGLGIFFYCYFGGLMVNLLLVLLMNVINGGVYVVNSLDFQEFMLVFYGVLSFCEVLWMGIEVFYMFKKLFSDKGMSIVVGDEGGFVLDLGNVEVGEILVEVISKVGYKFGEQIFLVLDVVSIEFFENGCYVFDGGSYISVEMVG